LNEPVTQIFPRVGSAPKKKIRWKLEVEATAGNNQT
jgi:hypothetical protein